MTWRTMIISFSRRPAKRPVKGFCPVTSTRPSRTHCQNCFCVVQNSLSFAQTIRAVFFAIALLPDYLGQADLEQPDKVFTAGSRLAVEEPEHQRKQNAQKNRRG